MQHEQWFISDTHFFHANMLKFTDNEGKVIRPFASLSEMHEYIVKKWNSVIGPNDYVYHLGDVYFKKGMRYSSQILELFSSLNGKKRLILGNHDHINSQSPLLFIFDKIMLWHGFKEHDFTAVHIPLPLHQLRDGSCCVHGHTHQNKLSDPHYINVCVETRDYTPVHIEQIRKEIKDITNGNEVSN